MSFRCELNIFSYKAMDSFSLLQGYKCNDIYIQSIVTVHYSSANFFIFFLFSFIIV